MHNPRAAGVPTPSRRYPPRPPPLPPRAPPTRRYSLDAHSHAELQLLDRLQQSVDRQLCIICLVAEVFLTSVLSHVQFAQAVLSSHPHTLDSLSVLGACARLRAGACGGPDGTGGGQGQLSGSGASLEGPGPRTGRGGSGGGGGKGAGGRRK